MILTTQSSISIKLQQNQFLPVVPQAPYSLKAAFFVSLSDSSLDSNVLWIEIINKTKSETTFASDFRLLTINFTQEKSPHPYNNLHEIGILGASNTIQPLVAFILLEWFMIISTIDCRRICRPHQTPQYPPYFFILVFLDEMKINS